MAKIANQTAYPIITPTIRDYFIVTDVEDNNNTKNVSIGSLQGFMGSQPPAEIILTGAQIQNLQGAPVIINVDNPTNSLVVPVSCAFYYTATTEPFNFAALSKIKIANENYSGLASTYFEFDATYLNTVTSSLICPVNTWGTTSQTFPLATPGTELVIFADNVSTQGTGTLKISIQYRLVATT